MTIHVDPATLDLADGVYFGLPEARYHALPRLSASGCKALLCSPATFWAQSWMNRERDDDDTPAKTIGRAFHVARLEPDRFADLYAREPDKAEWGAAGVLMTDAAVADRLADLGEPKRKAGELAADRAERLLAADPEARIACVMRAEWEAERGDRVPLSPDLWDAILADAEAMSGTPEVGRHLTGGAPEVTVLWTHEGVRLKARIDYLRPDGWADVKTFDNSGGAPLEVKLASAFRLNRYHVQAWVYHLAVEAIRTGALEAMDDDALGLVVAIRERAAPLDPWWLWQEKGGVPNVLARRVVLTAPHASHAHNRAGADDATADGVADLTRSPTRLGAKAARDVASAISTYRYCLDLWGEGEPWGAIVPSADLDEGLFSDYWLEE